MEGIARYGKAVAVLAAALGLFAAAWLAGGAAHAQPIPPAVYAGSVTLNGAPAPAGTVIVAYIGSTACGTVVVTTPSVVRCSRSHAMAAYSSG